MTDYVKLMDLISRVGDNVNALNIPKLSEVLAFIETVESKERFINDQGYLEALKDALSFKNFSSFRWGLERMLLTAIRHIGEWCYDTIRWEHPAGEYVLLFGMTEAITASGPESLWCIRVVRNHEEVVGHEYHKALTNNVLHAINVRMRYPEKPTIYGYKDPIHINAIEETPRSISHYAIYQGAF